MKTNSDYQRQLADKVSRIEQQFETLLPTTGSIEAFASPPWHFRQRAEFRLWHERGGSQDETSSQYEVFYAMFTPGKKPSRETLQRIDSFPIADKKINALMPQLLAELKNTPRLLKRLFQVEFLSTLRGQVLVSLIYHQALDSDWEVQAKALAECLSIHLIGRSRGQKVVLSQDYVTETLSVQGRAYHYRQIEGGFTQPNARVCEKMLEWACQVAAQMQTQNSDLLELYCGNGNFTLPLSQYFRRVLATEVAKTSVQAARHNIIENNCDNIAVARLSAQEITEALTGKRQFKRLLQDNINVGDYQLKSIFVDPPRAGVDDKTLHLMQSFEHIIYISCNPDTLWDNLQVLSQTHQVKRMALFDQFPYTQHVEMGVWLKRCTEKSFSSRHAVA